MQSIIDILHKNFQEDHTNSRRLQGFPGGFLNSNRFPGVVDTLKYNTSLAHKHSLTQADKHSTDLQTFNSLYHCRH